jgi:hypothetical protein
MAHDPGLRNETQLGIRIVAEIEDEVGVGAPDRCEAADELTLSCVAVEKSHA